MTKIFSNKEIKTFFQGVYQFKEDEEGYLVFYHFSDAQMDALNFEPVYYCRSKASSSSFMEFETDADKIFFDYKQLEYINSSKDSFDVYVNGIWYSMTKRAELPLSGRFEISLPKGKKQVAIYFPVDCEIRVKNFGADGVCTEIPRTGKKVLWIGDSITQGYGSLLSSQTYVSMVSRKLGYRSLNQGIGAYRYMTNTLLPLSESLDMIVVALGTNDIKTPEAEKAIQAFYERLYEIYPNVSVLVLTPLWRGDISGAEFEIFLKLRERIGEIASLYPNVKAIIDGFKMIPHLGQYFLDGVHPNAWGCEVYANNLAEELQRIGF